MNLEQLTHCPLCQSKALKDHLRTQDFSVSLESFTIQQCLACGLLITNPRPTTAELSRYYESPEYISHNDGQNNLQDRVYRLIRSVSLKQKLRLIQRQNESSTQNALDYGCGTGEFLLTLAQAGWKITGVEPNEQARTLATNKTRQTIYDQLSAIPSSQTYTLITLWHVLEHVLDLQNTFQQLTQRLDEQGTLIIAVPTTNLWTLNTMATTGLPTICHDISITLAQRKSGNWLSNMAYKLPSKYQCFLTRTMSLCSANAIVVIHL
ncbi:MAG: class I SAM-dependent methyltransferase [Cytophagales bacterium]|nr:class I SAM-dependent methyltransferase [Cytophagales bacterium]